MENKTIYYLIGGIAVIGIGYYFLNKNSIKLKDSEKNDFSNSDLEDVDKKSFEDEKTTIKAIKRDSVNLKKINIPLVKINKSKESVNTIKDSIKDTFNSTLKGLSKNELESKIQSVCGINPKYNFGSLTKIQDSKKYNSCRLQLIDKLRSEKLISFDGFDNLNKKKSYNLLLDDFENDLNLDL